MTAFKPEGAPIEFVGVVGVCDLRVPDSASPGIAQFDVREYVVTSQGDMILIRDGIGWTEELMPRGQAALGDFVRPIDLADRVRAVIIPDEKDLEHGGPHPWTRLAELAQNRGLEVEADALAALPYKLWFTETVIEWARG